MKKIIHLFLSLKIRWLWKHLLRRGGVFLLWCWLVFVWVSYAQSRWSTDTDPKDVLDHVVGKAWDNVISTTLDRVDHDQWWFDRPYRLANTLDSVRVNSSIYLQWLAFAVLVSGAVLIIYNALRLVLTPMQPDEAANVKTRLVYIIAWLLLWTWFYYLIKILLSVLIQVTS